MLSDEVTIPRARYEGLLKDSEWLAALEAAGVDNWSGIEYAYDLLNDK